MSCPCKQKLTDQQKVLINDQMGKSPIQNPVGDKAATLSSALTQSYNKLNSIKTLALTPNFGTVGGALRNTGVDVNRINKIMGDVQSMKGSVDTFKSQADLLSNPQKLMSVAGTMNFFGNIGCALGIEGIDVGVSIGVITQNGQNSISIAGGVQADLDKIIDSFSSNPYGEELQNAAIEFNKALDGIGSRINDATESLSKITQDSKDMITKAENMVKEYTQINFFSNLFGESSDPCNKMSVAISNSGLMTQQFQNLSAAANESVKASVSGLGGNLKGIISR